MQFNITLFVLGLASLTSVLADHSHDHEFEKITWASITSLPTKRSDMSATVSSASGKDEIYLIGGER